MQSLESNNDNYCYVFFSYLHCFAFYETRPNKRTKDSQYTTEIVVELVDSKGKVVPIRALLDTSTTRTIILRQIVAQGFAKRLKDLHSGILWAGCS